VPHKELTEGSQGIHEPLHETTEFIDYAPLICKLEEHSGTICFNSGFAHR
jgi:hypothetical protein